jgi:type I restriction enzyme M protein
MIQLRNQIDKLWTEFWTGGITNPLTVIEQISFLMFARMLDLIERRNDLKAQRGLTVKRLFTEAQQHLRWSRFSQLPGEEMLPLVRDQVFPHFRSLGGNGAAISRYMGDAQLLIQKPSLLVTAVAMIERLPLTEGDKKGDLYEYLLSKLTTAGINGQFRTPRHIISTMVELVDPRPGEVIGDPACGTGGFLIGALRHLFETNTSPDAFIEDTNDQGEVVRTPTGDLLEPHRDHLQTRALHGFDSPDVSYQDTLAESFDVKRCEWAEDAFDVILANPPFKGSLAVDDIHPWLRKQLKTTKTELLFVALMLRMLRAGGRCATIVPDGVLFGSSRAHVELRRMLVDEHQLEGVISLPSGVFKPYAGVSTAVIVFTKQGRTSDILYYDVQADGRTLDDKRQPITDNDLPDVVAQWKRWKAGQAEPTDRTAKCFLVPADEIRANSYDLSLNRYKEIVYDEPEYDPPREIIARLRGLEKEILADLDELEGMLG